MDTKVLLRTKLGELEALREAKKLVTENDPDGNSTFLFMGSGFFLRESRPEDRIGDEIGRKEDEIRAILSSLPS